MSSSANPAGGGDDAAGHGGLGMHGGGGGGRSTDGNGTPAGACWTLGRESESRKRKAAIVATETDYSMGNEEDFNVSNEDSFRISKEIEDLRSQLALKKKELKYYQENKKLRVQLALKVKVAESIWKENEQLKAQNKHLQENIIEILDSQIESKKRHLQQYESLRTRLELSNARLEEEIKNLHEANSEETHCLMSHQTCGNVSEAILEDEVHPATATSPADCLPWRPCPPQEEAAAGAASSPSPAREQPCPCRLPSPPTPPMLASPTRIDGVVDTHRCPQSSGPTGHSVAGTDLRLPHHSVGPTAPSAPTPAHCPPPHRNCLWILGHAPTLLDSISIWSGLVKDAEDRKCFFKAHDDDSLARTMDQFRLMQNSQVTDNVLRLNIECQCASELTGDNRATRPDEAQVEEPAHAEQAPVQAGGAAGQVHLDKLSPSLSRKRAHSLHEDQPDGQMAPSEELTDEEVIESAHAEQVHLAQLSPSPSRKRACLSQSTPGVQLTDEAVVLEEEDHPLIEPLGGLPQLAEAVTARTPVSYKKSKRKKSSVKCVNLYLHGRSASDERFWSSEHMNLYNIYCKKRCADNKWIDWEKTRRLPEMPDVEEACRDVGLHELMAIKQNWHEETIKQFYSTLFVNESKTSLTWMTGRNRKITVTKKFCQKVLHVPSEHSIKIENKLTDAQQEEIKSANGNQVNSLNRIIRKTINPAEGDRGNIHGLSQVLMYHILFRKPFDIVDMMFEEMANNHRNIAKRMPYAPYIMLLINSAIGEKFVPEGGGNECVHKGYRMELKSKETKDHTASKSKPTLAPRKKSKVMRAPLMEL